MEWVFLRGLTRESRHWGRFRIYFEEHVPDSKLSCLDLPGVGERNNELCPARISEIADQLRGRVAPLEPGQKRYLFAISLGAMVGMDWISRFQDQFSGAVIINSSAGNLSPSWQRVKPMNLSFLFRAFFMRDIAKRERRILSGMVNLVKGEEFERIAQEWIDIAKTKPVKRRTALRQIRAAKQFAAPRIKDFPILVLTSKADRLVSWKCSKALASYLEGTFVRHETAGHDLPIDDPKWITDQVLSWLQTLK